MRKLAWFAAAFSAAAALAVHGLPEGVLVPLGVACALAALAGLALRGDRRRRVLLAGFGLAAGLLWTAAYGALFQAPARALAGYEGPVEVTVADWPQATAYGSSVLVRLHPVEGWPVRTLLYLDAPAPDLRPGDGLTVQARLRAADTIAGESTDYYYAKGVRLIAYGEGEGETARPGRPPLWTWPAYVSKALKDRVAAAFPEEAAPLVTALLTGDRSGLSDGDYAALRRSGLAHVIAVSGLHVSFLAGLAAALLGARRRRTAVCTIALLVCFAAVVGNTPSVLRAVFMQSMLLLAPLLGREEDKPTSLCAVLMLLLLQNPYAAASVSLQLSFAAVAGIYLFSGPLTERWTARLPARPKGFWAKTGCLAARFVLSSLAVSLGAIAFTTPLTAWHFQSVSLVGPLANLLCLWAVSLAFLGGLAAAVLGLFLPGPAALLALPAALPTLYVQRMADALAALPFAALSIQSVYLKLWLALVYVLLLLYLLGRGEKKRPLVPLGLGTAGLCAALVLQAASHTAGRLTVSVLDVGQGLSVALLSGGRAALVDCGGTGADNPGDTAADYFQSLGLSRIDLVEEEDPLRREITALAEEKGIETLFLAEDADVTFGESALRIYAPLGSGGANEEGLSVLCTAGDFDGLITGDMNDTVEKRLIKYGSLPDLELLVAGHHGSKYATSEELLLATTPELAVISVGYNTYGHPAPETLERLAAAGCAIYRTDWSGTVTITAK